MYCPQCGRPNADTFRFCVHCGTPLPSIVGPAQPSVGQPPQITPEQVEISRRFRKKKKSLFTAYVWWYLFGAHHAYLGRWLPQLLFWVTIGGVLVWWLVDANRMQALVDTYNDRLRQRLAERLSSGRV